MTETQAKAIPGLASALLDLQQGDGTPLGVQKHLGIFLTPSKPKSESPALQDLFNHRIRNHILHSRFGSNSISKC